MSYLNRLSAEQAGKPDVVLRRVVALELSGRNAEERSRKRIGRKSRRSFPLLFSHLGVVASHAGHYALARRCWKRRFGNSHAMPTCSTVLLIIPMRRNSRQRRFGIWRRLRRQRWDGRYTKCRNAASNLGEFKASADAWNAYVRLAPSDDTGRREQVSRMRIWVGWMPAALVDLRWYVARHAGDADGWYELGCRECEGSDSGMSSLDKAIALKPDFAAARSVRGALYYRDGKPEVALPVGIRCRCSAAERSRFSTGWDRFILRSIVSAMPSVTSGALLCLRRMIIRHSFIWRTRLRGPGKRLNPMQFWSGSGHGR